MHLHRSLLPVFLLLSSCSHAAGSGTPLTPTQRGPIVFGLGTEESEVVDVVSTPAGAIVFVASPSLEPCVGEPSFLAICELAPGEGGELRERAIVELGPGEATSVAGHPSGKRALVVLKHERSPATGPGTLLVVEGDRIAARLALDPGPDSIAVTPDGRLAIVACEAETPDPEDCPGDAAADAEGSILILDLAEESRPRLVARVRGAELHRRYFREHPDRAPNPAAVEPELVAVAPDSDTALVTLQEQSAVAVLDLTPLRRPASASPDELGASVLAGVVLLPHDQPVPKRGLRGAHPDGIAFGPDGSYAITANEAHPKSRALQGLSVIDLRGGPRQARLAATHSIFDLDPTLRSEKERPVKKLGRKKTPAKRVVKLPRLDPEGIAIAERGSRHIAAVAIERRGPQDEAGSVLLLDVTGIRDGARPRRIDRHIVGATGDARPETLDFTADGRWLVVASEKDGGTLTLFDLGSETGGAR